MDRLVTNGIPYYCALGNHDAATVFATDPLWYTKWRTAFTNLPDNGPTNWLKLAYYVDVGAARLIFLDCITGGTNWGVDSILEPRYRIDGDQAIWLKSVIGTNSPQPFDIAIAHAAAYPVSTMHETSALNIWPTERDAFLQILVDAKATAYLVGHEHMYSLRKMDTRYNTNWTYTVPQIMNVSGGGFYGTNSDVPGPDALVTGTYCFSVIDLDPVTGLGTDTTFSQDGITNLYQVPLRPGKARLKVSSALGSPQPPSGTNLCPCGTMNCAITNSPIYAGALATQYVCFGWSGTGSVPTNGTGTNVTVILTNSSNTISAVDMAKTIPSCSTSLSENSGEVRILSVGGSAAHTQNVVLL